MTTFVKFIAALAFLCAVILAGYGYWLRGRYASSLDQLDHAKTEQASAGAQLAECNVAREKEKADADKIATDTAATLSASKAELDELRAQHAEAEKRLAAFRMLTEKFRKMIDSGKLQVTLRHGRMIVKLPAGILFASGSADLSKEGETAIREVAGILRQLHDRKFMVAGHTDNVPVGPPSPFKNNLQLSTARAETVTEQLIAAGMPPSHLAAAGYSEYEPVRENSNEAGRQENRRIEIVLLPNLAELPPLPIEANAGAAPSTAGATAAAAKVHP